jgi:hypothetical protein
MSDWRNALVRLRAHPAMPWVLAVVEVVWLVLLCVAIVRLWDLPAQRFPYWRF